MQIKKEKKKELFKSPKKSLHSRRWNEHFFSFLFMLEKLPTKIVGDQLSVNRWID